MAFLFILNKGVIIIFLDIAIKMRYYRSSIE